MVTFGPFHQLTRIGDFGHEDDVPVGDIEYSRTVVVVVDDTMAVVQGGFDVMHQVRLMLGGSEEGVE